MNYMYIYNVDFGVFDEKDAKYEALRSVATQLKSIFNVYMTYARQIFTPTRIE